MNKRKKLTTEQKLKKINKDVELWLLNFVKIINAKNETVPFKLNQVQKEFVKDKDKYNLILKSRQLGFSTLSLGMMLYYAYQIPNTTYLMVAHDGRSLRELFNRLKFMQNSIPKQYRLSTSKNNRDELELSNGSRIIIQGASDGLGAGMTLQMVHLSEYALYNNVQQEQGLATVEQTLAKNEDSIIIIESTARGVNNNFYRIWQNAEKGRSKYKPFFFSWCNRSHLDLFAYEVDIAEKWFDKKYGVNKIQKVDPLSTTPYEKILLEKTKVTIRQLKWRYWKLEDLSEETFRQEYPAFPNEAFISTDSGVFDANTIVERGNFLPDPLKNIEGLPLSLQRYIYNGLNIYQEPKPNEWYFGGTDTALGIGKKGDYSAICILNSEGEQVATFNRNDIPTYRFADIIDELGRFYNYTIFMVERNSYGIDILQRLHREKQYINLSKTKRKDKITGRAKWSHGWYSDNVSKTILVNDLRESFETGLILINDKETLEQMKIYQENKGSFGNLKGSDNYDDLVDAIGLAVQAMKQGRYYI